MTKRQPRIPTQKLIANVIFKGEHLAVWRNQHGHFEVVHAGVSTQKKLSASEIVRYLCNAMHEVRT